MEGDTEDLDITAVIGSTTEHQHFEVLMRAMDIFRDRNEVRGDLWAEFDIRDALHNAKSKLARLEQAAKKTTFKKDGSIDEAKTPPPVAKELVDSALDLINFTVFTIRHAEGSKP